MLSMIPKHTDQFAVAFDKDHGGVIVVPHTNRFIRPGELQIVNWFNTKNVGRWEQRDKFKALYMRAVRKLRDKTNDAVIYAACERVLAL